MEQSTADGPSPSRSRPRVVWLLVGDWSWGKKRHPAPAVDFVVEAERRRQLFGWVGEHAGSIATLLIFVFVVIKVLVISDGNTVSALGLVGSAGPLQVLAGVLVLSVAAIGTGLANYLLVYSGTVPGARRFDRRWLWVLFVFTALATSFVVSWVVTVEIVWFAVFLGYRWWRSGYSLQPPPNADEPPRLDLEKWLQQVPDDVVLRQHHSEIKRAYHELLTLKADPGAAMANERVGELEREIHDENRAYEERLQLLHNVTRRSLNGVILVAAFVIVFPVIANAVAGRNPWMPAETLKTSGQQGAVVGYVVSDSDGWTTVLLEDSRLLLRIESSSIVSRTVCLPSGERTSTVKTIWNAFAPEAPAYPPCTDN